ncbi:MAG: polysaccharide biosynthesis/export family protein [Deltaproteobacteria bacterium]|nr:polysaccharide biosynthesis/export family protein [Deltaproteobacteria bacterium]
MAYPPQTLWVRIVFFELCFLFFGCGTTIKQTPQPLSVGEDDTTLGPGDVFEVNVYGDKDLSGKHKVAKDGSIDFPLVGRVVVAGKEPTEVSEDIARKLIEGEILLNPQVSVFVTEYVSKRVSVVGAVSRPGTFPMSSGLTVVQAISLAGGFTSLASRNETLVTRRDNQKTERFRVPVERVAEGRADDFALQAGDIIYVPERLF